MFTDQYLTTFARGGGGGEGEPLLLEMTLNSMEKNSYDFCPNDGLEFVLNSPILRDS